MPIEMNSDKAICSRCATAYTRKKGFFPVSYAALYRGAGYLPYCKNCIDTMYTEYLAQCNDTKQAVRQMCRKLDLFWSDVIYERVSRKATTRSMMTNYIQAVNNLPYAGKSYDDTLIAEGTLWVFDGRRDEAAEDDGKKTVIHYAIEAESDVAIEDIPEDVLMRWGSGYPPSMYQDLEQRRMYWVNNLPGDVEPDVGMEALIKQICVLEIDIARLTASGKSAEKQIGMLDKLISSMSLKPGQKSDDGSFEKTPYGVWIDRLEHERPVRDPDPELDDVDGIIKKISIWFLGHAAKLLNIKNLYSKLYEDAMEQFRADYESYDEEDDEEEYENLFNRIFGGDGEE